MEKLFFIDESIFEGWLEFETPLGRIRAEKKDSIVFIYIQKENSFILNAKVKCKFEPELIYKTWSDL